MAVKYLHIDAFRAKVKNASQSGHKDLLLSRTEALSLQSDISELLLRVVELQEALLNAQTTQISLKGGDF